MLYKTLPYNRIEWNEIKVKSTMEHWGIRRRSPWMSAVFVEWPHTEVMALWKEADSDIVWQNVTGCGKTSLRFFESVDLCTDFERRAQFHVHSAHEVVLCKQQQGLSVNLLWPELCCNIMAPLEQVEEMQRWAYDSKDIIKIYYIRCSM